uniref:Uncharacterized protein n=1 Tax=Rhizophora mucronata TaxID=61149 RepID=A0A2P2N5Q8_RHIMU
MGVSSGNSFSGSYWVSKGLIAIRLCSSMTLNAL